MDVLLSEHYKTGHGNLLHIQFGEIPAEGLWLEILDESWFPDHEIARKGPVKVAIHVKKQGSKRVLLEGTLKTIILLDCDRCLESFEFPLESSFKVDLELVDKSMVTEHPIAEHACSSNEMDVMFLEEPVIDVFYVLQQQVFLVVPEKKLCKPNCQGLCPKCGAKLSSEQCRCATTPDSSPFGILGTLKDQENM